MLNITNSRLDTGKVRTIPVVGGALENSYIMKRVDDGFGNTGVSKATGVVGEDIVGVAHISPIAATTRAVVDEAHQVNVGATDTVQLGFSSVDLASLYIWNATTNLVAAAPLTVTASGLITWTTGDIAPTDDLLISYRRSVTLDELRNEGLPLDFANRINGFDGGVEVVSGNSQIETDFYDTSVAYAIGDLIYSTADGIPSSAMLGDSWGRVAGVPTEDTPVLNVTFNLAI